MNGDCQLIPEVKNEKAAGEPLVRVSITCNAFSGQLGADVITLYVIIDCLVASWPYFATAVSLLEFW